LGFGFLKKGEYKKFSLGKEVLDVGGGGTARSLGCGLLGTGLTGRGTTLGVGGGRTLLALLLFAEGQAALSLGVGVELDEGAEVGEGVLLEEVEAVLALGRAKLGLDLIRVDDAGQIRVGHHGARQMVVGLLAGALGGGAVEGVKAVKGLLGPDDEAAEVTTRSKLKKVQTSNSHKLDTGQVAEGLEEVGLLVVHNKGSTALDVATVAHFTDSTADLAAGTGLLNISISNDLAKELHCISRLSNVLDGFVGNNKRDFRNTSNVMSASLHEGGEGRGSESRGDSISALVHADNAVPPAPDLGGSEHTTATAHVTEGTLSSAVRSTTGNTGNTGHGATGTPALYRGLMTSSLRDSVGLAVVLGDVGVYKVYHIGADWA